MSQFGHEKMHFSKEKKKLSQKVVNVIELSR